MRAGVQEKPPVRGNCYTATFFKAKTKYHAIFINNFLPHRKIIPFGKVHPPNYPYFYVGDHQKQH